MSEVGVDKTLTNLLVSEWFESTEESVGEPGA